MARIVTNAACPSYQLPFFSEGDHHGQSSHLIGLTHVVRETIDYSWINVRKAAASGW